jgi:hypothetical protein
MQSNPLVTVSPRGVACCRTVVRVLFCYIQCLLAIVHLLCSLASYTLNQPPCAGIKITQEPPKGLRANLQRTYAELPPGTLDLPPGHPLPHAWRKLVFAGATFHALLQV